jgi:hypothetical protein
MSADKPNHLKVQSGELTFGTNFGPVANVTPIHFPGNGHQPHLEARFVGGTRIDFTPATFLELLRAGQEALAKLPSFPDIHDAVGNQE